MILHLVASAPLLSSDAMRLAIGLLKDRKTTPAVAVRVRALVWLADRVAGSPDVIRQCLDGARAAPRRYVLGVAGARSLLSSPTPI